MKPGRKDWCSRWPDTINGQYYGDCCRRHDWCYSIPGDRHDRARADRELRECVTARAGKAWGWIMYRGVRLVGWLPWHFSRTIFGRKMDEAERKELGDRVSKAT